MNKETLKRIPGATLIYLALRWLLIKIVRLLVETEGFRFSPRGPFMWIMNPDGSRSRILTGNTIYSVPFVNIVGEAIEHWHYTKLLGEARQRPVYCISPKVFPSDSYLPFLFQPQDYEFYAHPAYLQKLILFSLPLVPEMEKLAAHWVLAPLRKRLGAFEFFKSGYTTTTDPIYAQMEMESPAIYGYVRWRQTANTFTCCQEYMDLLIRRKPLPVHELPGYRESERLWLFHILGITKPFVCIHTRPYAKQGQYVYNPDKETDPRSIQSFEPYLDAIEYLTHCGYQVVRTGIRSEVEPLTRKIPGYIDYASSVHQNAKNDLYLAGNCKFFISAKSGPEILAMIFRRPVLGLNYGHFPMMFTVPEMRFYPRPIVDSNGNTIPLTALLSSEFYYSYSADAYNRAGVRTRQITAEQTLDAVKEFLPLVEDPKTDWRQRSEAQQEFFKLVRPEHLDLYLAQGAPLNCYLHKVLDSAKDRCL